MIKFEKINYRRLNARQKENFNYQKVSAILADYGFVTLRLSKDWQGADFIALHISGDSIPVQLKSRLAFYQKYSGRGLYVAFAEGDTWYLHPHDELLTKIIKRIGQTTSWREDGGYSFPQVPKELRNLVEPYRISGDTKTITEVAAG